MGYPRTVLALGTAVTLAALALRAPVTAQEAGPPPAPAAPAPPPGEASVTLDVTHTLALTGVPG